jgi:DNA invertase Pin-like site-specific DNA recombinase
VFWKSDRWGRSAAHVLITIGGLRGRGVTVKSLTENFDLDTKEGRFMFAVLAAAAEYELKLRAERQAEGIAAARHRGALVGLNGSVGVIGSEREAHMVAGLADLPDRLAAGMSVARHEDRAAGCREAGE